MASELTEKEKEQAYLEFKKVFPAREPSGGEMLSWYEEQLEGRKTDTEVEVVVEAEKIAEKVQAKAGILSSTLAPLVIKEDVLDAVVEETVVRRPKATRRIVTISERGQIRQLRTNGMSLPKISKEVSRSLSTVQTITKDIKGIIVPSGRPRSGDVRRCVICDHRFYARPYRKNHSYTCSNSCANKITGKFRWLKYSDSFNEMSEEGIEEYINNLLPFPKECNPDAWDYYFNTAYSLIAEHEVKRFNAENVKGAIRELVAGCLDKDTDPIDHSYLLLVGYLKKEPELTIKALFGYSYKTFTVDQLVEAIQGICLEEILKQSPKFIEVKPGTFASRDKFLKDAKVELLQKLPDFTKGWRPDEVQSTLGQFEKLVSHLEVNE